MKKKIFLGLFLILFLPFLYLYYEATKLSDFKILSFSRFQYDDALENRVVFEKNSNAKSYEVTLKKEDGTVLYQEVTEEDFMDFPSLDLVEKDSIIIEVVANGKAGKTKTSIYETVWGDAPFKVREVTSTRKSGPVSGRKSILLSTKTKDSTIYYTLDGSEPNEESLLYRGERIDLDQSKLLRVVAYKDGYLPSEVTIFDYKVSSTTPIIYLSPSTQDENKGVEEVGYTTEKEMMNKIADFVYDKLKREGYEVIRNKKVSSFKEAIKDARGYDVDLHLAIHSNSSESKKNTGIETWIYDDQDEVTLEIAELIQDNLFSIYYKKTGNRGVKFSSLTIPLAETDPKNVNHGVLVEVAFHDNLTDAKWIVDNIEEIGLNLADSVISYFS